MDNSAAQSQGSLSSINASSQALDTPAVVSSSNPPSEFVNHGLLLWNQSRQRWLDSKKRSNKKQQLRDSKIRSRNDGDDGTLLGDGDNVYHLGCRHPGKLVKVQKAGGFTKSDARLSSYTDSQNWNATYESLLGTNKPFPQPVPLNEMVDFLVDAWEQEGLYD